MRRTLLAFLVALGLAPGLVWRSEPPPPDHTQRFVFERLALPRGEEARIGAHGPLVTGAWHLSSPNTGFGSYSALVASGPDTLLAISDRGQYAFFTMPGHPKGRLALGTVLPGSDQFKAYQDMELATRDPATGHVWVGLEFSQAIMRLGADLSEDGKVSPPRMKHWRSNGGPEALVRLADGRFVVLAESRIHWRDKSRPGLLFAGDPVDGATPVEFKFVPPAGYDPADMALLPDGRVLILFRGLQFIPPGFAVRLAIADPAGIRAGEVWRWRDVGPLSSALPIDNYEGLAVTGGADGDPVTLWLVSDDNGARITQRTLLLRMEWQVPPRQ